MSFTNETEKQKYYIQKCKELVKIKEQPLSFRTLLIHSELKQK